MSESRSLVDTDVLVDFLRGHPKAIDFVESHAATIAVSAITVAELFAGARDEDEERVLKEFVEAFPVLPVDGEVARLAGRLKRDHGPTHGTGLADAMIAATAIVTGAALKTLDTKHFPMMRGLRPAYRK